MKFDPISNDALARVIAQALYGRSTFDLTVVLAHAALCLGVDAFVADAIDVQKRCASEGRNAEYTRRCVEDFLRKKWKAE